MMQASDAVDDAMTQGATARATAGMSRQARVLLNQASEAQAVSCQSLSQALQLSFKHKRRCLSLAQ